MKRTFIIRSNDAGSEAFTDEYVKNIEFERDTAQQMLREAIDELDAKNQGYWDLNKYERWMKSAGKTWR